MRILFLSCFLWFSATTLSGGGEVADVCGTLKLATIAALIPESESDGDGDVCIRCTDPAFAGLMGTRISSMRVEPITATEGQIETWRRVLANANLPGSRFELASKIIAATEIGAVMHSFAEGIILEITPQNDGVLGKLAAELASLKSTRHPNGIRLFIGERESFDGRLDVRLGIVELNATTLHDRIFARATVHHEQRHAIRFNDLAQAVERDELPHASNCRGFDIPGAGAWYKNAYAQEVEAFRAGAADYVDGGGDRRWFDRFMQKSRDIAQAFLVGAERIETMLAEVSADTVIAAMAGDTTSIVHGGATFQISFNVTTNFGNLLSVAVNVSGHDNFPPYRIDFPVARHDSPHTLQDLYFRFFRQNLRFVQLSVRGWGSGTGNSEPGQRSDLVEVIRGHRIH